MITVKEAVEISVLCCSLAGIIWRIAEVKAKIEASISRLDKSLSKEIEATKNQFYKDVDGLKDITDERTRSLDKLLELHIQKCDSENTLIKYQVEEQYKHLTESVTHLKNRLSGSIVFERLEGRVINLTEVIEKKFQL
jgi:hypothetical protein